MDYAFFFLRTIEVFNDLYVSVYQLHIRQFEIALVQKPELYSKFQ